MGGGDSNCRNRKLQFTLISIGKSLGIQGCPHACGDGPKKTPLLTRLWLLSPRVWGWSVQLGRVDLPNTVVPTRVGMVRSHNNENAFARSCPHACGDGPAVSRESPGRNWLSPRVWGWSVDVRLSDDPMQVVPTRVGMVRTFSLLSADGGRCPHACGDGPRGQPAFQFGPLLSPRVWGWSAIFASESPCDNVVPTRVGMVRCAGLFARPSLCCPHACGDGPAPKQLSP